MQEQKVSVYAKIRFVKWHFVFLVCEDHGDDINYVVARIPSSSEPLDEDWKLAISEVERNKKQYPKSSFYITVEKVPVDRFESYGCLCEKGTGECVGDLGCQCSPLASCKRVDQESHNPMEYWKDPEEPILPASNLNALIEPD